jgi:hydroxymethylbilane synthase
MRVDGLHFRYLEAPQWLPAVGQGALAIEGRMQNGVPTELMAKLNDSATFAATICERAFLNRLGAGCQAPVGALAQIAPDGGIQMDVAIYSRDGATCVRHAGTGSANWCLENGAQGLIAG